MPESKVKGLHVAANIDELDSMYNIPDLKKKSALQLCKSARTVFVAAEKYKSTGDEERSYILFMKYLLLVQQLKMAPDYDKEKSYVVNMLGPKSHMNALDYANTLKNSLILRYEIRRSEQKSKLKENLKIQDVEMKDDRPMVVQKKKDKYDDIDISIKSNQLFELLKDESKNVLILDIRPIICYNESHIKFPKCISIPEEYIQPGTSANSLGKIIPEASIPIWLQRDKMNFIILYDWNSTDFIPGKTLHILKTILLKWDPNVVYQRSPIILEGGYENWLLTYPTYTTNPHIAVPDVHNDLDDMLNDIEYPPLHELSPIEKNVDFDRSIKPNNFNNIIGNNSFVSRNTNPGIDRSSKAAAMQTYEERDRAMKTLLEEQEKIAGSALKIEKQRVLAEEKWEELRKDSEISADNDTTNQLREQELLSEIMQLESAQRDMALENQQLRNQLLEYMKREQDESNKTSEMNSSISKTSSSSLSSLSNDSINVEGHEDANNWNQSTETLDKEKRIRDIEEEKAALAKKRETMQADREKILAEAREKKKLLYHESQEEEENNYNISTVNRSYSTQDLPEPKIPDIPHFDRTMKPAPLAYHAIRERDFGDRREKTSPGLTGLKNLGFTCYMNSIIQCLNNTVYLADYFREGKYRKHISERLRSDSKENGTQGVIAEEVAAVIQTLWSGQYRFISTRDLKNVVGKYKNMFRGVEQHDSHEFLVILMDWLHDDLQISTKQLSENLSPADKAWLEYTKSKESLILRLFHGQIKSTVTCLMCGKKSVTYDSFSNLSLGLPADKSNRYSLNDCLKLYLSGEEITNWDCPCCKTKRKATKKLDISKLPPVLIIHFNRFYQDYSTNTCRKKQTYIDFPLENLTMPSCQDDKSVVYSLYGVSNHYGTMEGGHYTAYCKSSYHRSWYKFDDHLVTGISPSDVKSSAAYILFYTSLKDSAFKN
ncbi:ubiquitin specific protease 8 [Arctopsyche grandis]|uniref:ubiquitin specific protease 8 n=1 Tax=Arctopsyche grandis TaxID=121162 RepID=UPI00406DA374